MIVRSNRILTKMQFSEVPYSNLPLFFQKAGVFYLIDRPIVSILLMLTFTQWEPPSQNDRPKYGLTRISVFHTIAVFPDEGAIGKMDGVSLPYCHSEYR